METVKRYCPFCKTGKPMRKAGFDYRAKGRLQRWECRSKPCRRITVHPLKER